MWRWDGTQWVPTSALGAQPVRRARRAWIWWLAGGCLVLVVVGIVGVAFTVANLVNAVKRGAYSCLPSDFPTYPGASVTGDYTYYGTNVAPGDTHECQMGFTSQDDATTVTAFYKSRLSSGSWTIISNDTANGRIAFRSSSRAATVGTVQLFGQGQHTVIQVRLDS